MKIAKKALALFLCTIMLMSCLYVGGDLGFMADGIKAYAADKNSIAAFEQIQNESSPRLELNFNKNWKFHYGNNDVDKPAQPDTNDNTAAWKNVNLPHDYSIEQEFTANGTERESGNLPGGDGWYRKTFVMPVAYEGKRVILNFDGSYNETSVYVNGKPVGENFYGYNSFSIDITEHLKFGGEKNVVAVHTNSQIPSSRWYSGSGIYRDVTMTIVNPLHVGLYGTHVEMPNLESSNGSDGTIINTVTLNNDSEHYQQFYVKTTLFNADGTTAAVRASDSFKIEANATKDVKVTVPYANPKLWDTKTPNLYTVRTEILIGDNVIDSYDEQIGFRWIKWDAQTGFSLNGKPTKLEGVCMHHDQGALGAVQNRDAIARQIDILKDMGVNAIRTSHNVPSKVFLDLCNEKGILVMEEFFDGLTQRKNGNTYDFARYFNTKMTDRGAMLIGGSTNTYWSDFVAQQTVKRDRNDPSVIIWSLGNEIYVEKNPWQEFATIAERIKGIVNKLDNTRPMTQGNNKYENPWEAEKVDTVMDVIGGNYGPANWEKNHSKYFTDKPFVATESTSSVNSRGVYNATWIKGFGGANALYKAPNANHLGSYDTTKVSWGSYAAEAWSYAAKNAWFSGEFVWTGFDYIGEPTPWNGDAVQSASPNSSYFGIIDTAGFAKDSYYLYRSMWNEDSTTLHLVPGTWTADELTLDNGYVNVAVYSNADHIDLLLDGAVIATAKSTAHVVNDYKYLTWAEETKDADKCNTTEFVTGAGTDFYAQFNVKYTGSKKLSVKAYDAAGNDITNEAVGTKQVVKDAQAVKIVAKPWNDVKTLTADGKSLAYVELTAVDAQGNTVVGYNNTIKLGLTGNGKILGVDNGDQTSTAKFQSGAVLATDKKGAEIKMFHGKALVIIGSTDDAGNIELTVEPSDSTIVEGNTTKMFRNVNGVVTLNSVEEKGKATADEFEEIVPQLVNDKDTTIEPLKTEADTTRCIGNRKNGSDHITVKYYRDMYLDMSETIQGVGYKYYLNGNNGGAHYGDDKSNSMRIFYHSPLWGADSVYIKDRTFIDNFTGYKATLYSGSTDSNSSFDVSKQELYDMAHDKYSNGYQDWVLQLNGKPKKTGDFYYNAAKNNLDARLWTTEYYSFFNWYVDQEMWAYSDRNHIKDPNNGNNTALLEMTIHVYDKSNLKNWVNVDKVMVNEPYKNLLVDKGAWQNYVNALDPTLINNAMPVIKERENTQADVERAENTLRPAVNAANELVFKAPDQDLQALKDKITEAKALVNDPSFEGKYTNKSKQALKDKINAVDADPLSKNAPEYRVNMNDFNSIDAGYKAHADMLKLQKLLKELQAAIDGLQADAQKKVKATLFKYGYDNTKSGEAKYYGGGRGMNNLAINTMRDIIGNTNGPYYNGIVNAIDNQNSYWAGAGTDLRMEAINGAIDAYANYYSLLFTSSPVQGQDAIVTAHSRHSYDGSKAKWNNWRKANTPSVGKSDEEGASVQGLANPVLTTGSMGEKYFTSHGNYTEVDYINPVSGKYSNGVTPNYKFRKDLLTMYGNLKLPALKNIAPYSPDFFKKEALDINGKHTNATTGNFAKYYWDTELPLKTTTEHGSNYFEYNSANNNYILQTKFDDANHKATMTYKDTPDGWSLTGPAEGHGFFPFNYQQGTTNLNNENAIYHYGMTFTVDFRLPEGGKHENGEDIVFEFIGDDDVYVYIDGQLVLDNGGIHDARKATINFTDESVSYQYAMNATDNAIKTGPKNSTGEIYYKFGADNGDISADNLSALRTLNQIKESKNTHTLTFFFLERGSGSSNCGIKFNMPAASEDVKLNRQSYVVDYDAKMKADISENDVISTKAHDNKNFKQEYLGIAYMNNYETLPHQTFEFRDADFMEAQGMEYTFANNGKEDGLRKKIDFNTQFGNYTLHDDGRLEFKATTMNYTSQDYFYVVSKITADPSFSDNAVYYYYEPVTVAPATSVYYEDNAEAIQYHHGSSKTLNSDHGKWKVIGNEKIQNDLSLNLQAFGPGEGHYGYNAAYDNFSTYSAGAAHNVKVSAQNAPNKGGTLPTATFDFTGTGFDVISATKNTTGVVRVEVKDDNGKIVANRMVDTYYNQKFGQLYRTADGNITLDSTNNTPVYFSVNGAYTTVPTHYETVDGVEKVVAGEATGNQKAALAYGWLNDNTITGVNNEIYQAPVVKVENLPYGHYSVTIKVAYSSRFAHGNADYDFILDAIRIHNPLDPANKMTNGLHVYQGEGNEVDLELRDKLIGSETVAAEQNGVLMFNGAPLESKALDSFIKGCPTHEVYLTNGSAVAFHLWAKEIPQHAKIAAKLVKDNMANLTVTVGNKSAKMNLNTATDMYYNLSDLIKSDLNWTKDKDGWYKSDLITISNTTGASSTISLTNVQLTFAKKSEAQLAKADVPEAKLMVTSATPRMFSAAMRMDKADLAINVVGNPTVKLNDDGYSVITMNVQTSTDVDKLTVKNEYNGVLDAAITSTVDGNVKNWTVKFIEKSAGKHSYTVEGEDANGYTGSADPLEVTITAKKTPVGFFTKKAIKNFFDKLFGRK